MYAIKIIKKQTSLHIKTTNPTGRIVLAKDMVVITQEEEEARKKIKITFMKMAVTGINCTT